MGAGDQEGEEAQEMQCKGAKVQRWKGEDKWTSGRVDKWDREMQEAVERCKGAKVQRWKSGKGE